MSIEKEELDIIRSSFQNNEETLKIVRALFLGLPVSKDEKQIIRDAFSNTELLKIMNRRFCPSLDRNASIGKIQDVRLGMESQINGGSRDAIKQAIGYKDMGIKMIQQSLKLLSDPDGEQVSIEYAEVSCDEDPLQIGLLARNQYIRLVESQLNFLWQLTNMKIVSPIQQKNIQKKNSSK